MNYAQPKEMPLADQQPGRRSFCGTPEQSAVSVDIDFTRRLRLQGEVEIRTAGDEQTGLGLHEQLGYTARRQPVRVGGRDRSHVGGLALDVGLVRRPARRP
jgi:hypothetical protein